MLNVYTAAFLGRRLWRPALYAAGYGFTRLGRSGRAGRRTRNGSDGVKGQRRKGAQDLWRTYAAARAAAAEGSGST
jgi:hypothetical protein